MWNCKECGTEGIITSEPFCPHCFSPRQDVPAVPSLGEAEVPHASESNLHAAGDKGSQALEGDWSKN